MNKTPYYWPAVGDHPDTRERRGNERRDTGTMNRGDVVNLLPCPDVCSEGMGNCPTQRACGHFCQRAQAAEAATDIGADDDECEGRGAVAWPALIGLVCGVAAFLWLVTR